MIESRQVSSHCHAQLISPSQYMSRCCMVSLERIGCLQYSVLLFPWFLCWITQVLGRLGETCMCPTMERDPCYSVLLPFTCKVFIREKRAWRETCPAITLKERNSEVLLHASTLYVLRAWRKSCLDSALASYGNKHVFGCYQTCCDYEYSDCSFLERISALLWKESDVSI
jgi:hypothetical protein